jgi:hypothetical protein
MTKKNIFLIVLAVLLGGLSLYLNRDRFQSESIRIGSRSVPPRGAMLRRDQKAPANPMIFFFKNPLKLTSVKVYPVTDLQTNKFPLPIWELASESNSVPVKEFAYGPNIRGMKPAIKGAVAPNLQPGITYRLFIEAGSLKAEHDFTPTPRSP